MLKLILGRAGSGKTEYVFSSIKKFIENGEKNILLITPEQYSFVAQRRLLKELGESNVNNVEESSFSRLSTEILNKNGQNHPVLSKGAKAVIMKEAIETVQDSLVLFNKNISSVSFINSVIKIYDEMKSCRVSYDDIVNASNESDKEILSAKLMDIANIISAYDAIINNEYFDPANELTRLYEKLIKMDYFKDRIVFIDGFSGFVAQEYKILEVVLKQSKAVYITFCTDSFIGDDKYSLFSYVNSNIEILKGVCEKIGVNIDAPIIFKENKRSNNKELLLCEKYTFSNVIEKKALTSDNIVLYGAANIYDECDNTAFKISELLRNGYRAKDITVICRDLEKYEKELNFSFDKYNIPYFNDERQSIKAQPLVMFVNFLLRIFIYSYKSEDIFSLLKTGLTSLDNEEISNLENYAFLWNINGSKWKTEFTESTKGFVEEISESDKEKIEAINVSRRFIVSKLEKFKKNAENKTAKDICGAIYYALIDFKSDEKLKELAILLDNNNKHALAEEQGKIWNLVMQILNSLAEVCGDKKLSFKEFYKLFALMINNEDLGTVPVGLDNVQLGSADRIRCDNPRVVFILGANEGEFPQSISSSGLLSENDRAALIKNNFKLYSYGEALNAQEKYFAYMAVSAPSERLYISYFNTEEGGAESSIVRGIKSVFPNLIVNHRENIPSLSSIESKNNAFEILAKSFEEGSEIVSSLKAYFENEDEFSSRYNAVKNIYFNSKIELKDKELAEKLFEKNMYLSASRIEDYYNCGFRYFCKFGLGARPREKAAMDPMQTGTVIHYVLEQIIKHNGSDGLTNLTDSEITILVNAYLEKYLKTKMGDFEQFTPRFKYQFMRLSKMLISVVKRLKEEFLQSDFKAKAFELTIGDGNCGESVKSHSIPLSDGGSIRIKGAIDRVDTFIKNGKQYVRVVDYKSGNKEFRLSDILNGINLQMFIYLFTLCKSDNELSGIESGVLYMHSSRRLFQMERHSDSSEISSEENKLYKMKGVILNDSENEVAEYMEHDLKGKFIPARYSKSLGLTGNIITLDELGRLSKKINQLISEMGMNLHNGIINQNPINGKYHDKTCDFCDYSDVCKNRKEIEHKEMLELSNEDALKILKEEQND